MNQKTRSFIFASIVALLPAWAAVAADSPSLSKTNSPAKSASNSPLEPIAFLTGGKWEAKLPDQPDGSHVSIIAQFTWANNHQAIRISNSFVVGGKTMPYIDGLYAWDPKKRAIVFWYVDAKGSLTEGAVKIENNALVHEFQETDPAGATKTYTARVTRDGPDAWTNEIFAASEGRLDPMIKVRYERIQ